MKAIILCAGYGTRLDPNGCAKPLLKIGGRPLLDYIVDRVKEIDNLDEIIVVSNHKFINEFESWRDSYGDSRIRVLDDRSTSNENRKGALRDLEFALSSCNVQDDFLVISGDNLIEFSLRDFYQEFKGLEKSLIGVYDIKDIEKVRNRHGVVILDGNKVVDFQEKPAEPKSTIKSFLCYLFKPEVRDLLKEYLSPKTNNPDAPGYFMEWLVKREEVYAHDVGEEKVFDIGNQNSLREIRERFDSKPH